MRWVTAWVVWGALLLPGAGQAQSPEEDFAAGVRAFDAGDIEGALASFRRSYQARPVPEVLFNIAVAERRLGRDGHALRDFLRFLRDAPSSERRAEAERQVRELVPRVGTVRLQVGPAGATITLDGVALGTAPLGEEVVLEPGRHELVVAAGRHRTDRRELVVRAGSAETVQIDLQPTGEPESQPDPDGGPSSDLPEGDGPGALPWIVLAGSGAILVTGGVLVAVGAADRALVEDPPEGAEWADFEGAYGRAAPLQNVGLVLLAVGVVGAGVGVALLLTSPERRGAEVSAGLGPGGLVLRGRW